MGCWRQAKTLRVPEALVETSWRASTWVQTIWQDGLRPRKEVPILNANRDMRIAFGCYHSSRLFQRLAERGGAKAFGHVRNVIQTRAAPSAPGSLFPATLFWDLPSFPLSFPSAVTRACLRPQLVRCARCRPRRCVRQSANLSSYTSYA